MQSKNDAWLKEHRHDLHTTHSLFVDAQDGFDFCQKLGITPEINGGSLRAMTKEEQFDGKEVQVTFSNWVSIYITKNLELTLYISSHDGNTEKWQELWQSDKRP